MSQSAAEPEREFGEFALSCVATAGVAHPPADTLTADERRHLGLED